MANMEVPAPDGPSPQRLFKHMESQWVRRFLETGDLRIRPLSYFRTSEPRTQDEMEGRVERRIRAEEPITMTNDEFNQLLGRDMLRSASGGKLNVKLLPGSTTGPFRDAAEDAYVFCVSETDQPTCAPRGGELLGSGFAIVSLAGFGNMLQHALRAKGIEVMFWSVGPIRYADTQRADITTRMGVEEFRRGPAPAACWFRLGADWKPEEWWLAPYYWTKRTVFAPQREWRYVFSTVSPIETPFVDVQCHLPWVPRCAEAF
jgi:hypothetical protein